MNFTAPVFWRVVRTAPEHRDEAAIGNALAALSKFLDIADARLSRSAHLAGEEFTLADVQFGHVLFRYYDIAIPRREHPSVRRYYAALAARPAFREHVMISYEDLRGTRTSGCGPCGVPMRADAGRTRGLRRGGRG